VTTLTLVFAAIFGSLIGSFLNVCIFRLPRRCLRLWRPKLSFCPKCRRTLEWWENVPILGYVFLGGRCRTCRAPIPLRYFFVELGTSMFFLYLADRELVGEARDFPLFFVHATLGAAFIVAALVDWDHRIIPDEIDVPGFLLAPLVCFFVPRVLGDDIINLPRLASNVWVLLDSALPWWGLSEGATAALVSPFRGVHDALAHTEWALPVSAAFTSIVGAASGGGLVWVIGWLGEKAFKKEAMGFGDVKLMAMIGGFLGWQGVLYSMVLACIAGSVYGVAHKVRSGRPVITGRDIVHASPLAWLALRFFGAPAPPRGYRPLRAFVKSKHEIALGRLGGPIAARFATGDSYLPFGPFLILGAFVCAFWPGAIHDALWKYSEWMGSLFRPR